MIAPQARRQTLKSISDEANGAVEEESLYIPRTAFTLGGFRDWVKSDACPEDLSPTFIQGDIYLDWRGRDLDLFIPRTARTHDGFRDWVKSDDFPEGLRVTYLNGEIHLDMSKEELETHAAVKTEVSIVVGGINKESKQGKLYIDGALVTNRRAKVSNRPDAVFVTYRSIKARRIRLMPRKNRRGQYLELAGIPDWILEILSDSSVRKDMLELMAAYHRAGIREYWLIDARGDEIDFQVLLWRKSGYAPAPSRGGWQRSQVFKREFRLERKHDECGYREHTLRVRPIQ